MTRNLTAIIQAEDGGFVALCPQLDVCSQGDTVEQARANLQEALELFFETAPSDEVARRRGSHVVMQKSEPAGTITVPVPDHVELRRGTLRSIIRQSGLEKAEFETD